VRGWPTLYLIDAQGKVRNKWLGNPGEDVLDKTIEALVAEAKGGAKAPEAKKSESPR
jgi:hypothetical protein